MLMAKVLMEKGGFSTLSKGCVCVCVGGGSGTKSDTVSSDVNTVSCGQVMLK